MQLQRRWRECADRGAIGLLEVSTSRVSLEPLTLTRLLTDAEAKTKESGIETGMTYTVFLDRT